MTSIRERPSLDEQTDQWCRQAEMLHAQRAEGCRCGGLVREGILLRRHWDRLDPEAPLRRRLLKSLPALQNLCQQHLAHRRSQAGGTDPATVHSVLRQLCEDDEYLRDLLDDPALPPTALAFAVECFRDDLHWLGTQVAVLDGHQGVDFLGRVLLEQEALQQEIDAREDDLPDHAWRADSLKHNGHSSAFALDHPTLEGVQRSAAPAQQRRQSLEQAIAELRKSAQQLRATALARQTEFLLHVADPGDSRGWYHLWQAASRLEPKLASSAEAIEQGCHWRSASAEAGVDASIGFGRKEAESRAKSSTGETPLAPTQAPREPNLPEALTQRRRYAADRWKQGVLELPPAEQQQVLGEVVDDLGDTTSETLTFLEELPLPEGARSLDALEQDIAAVRQATQQCDAQQHSSSATASNHNYAGLERTLARRENLVAVELQERHLAWRMEQLFGRRAVTVFERLVLGLLVLFLIMLAVEGPLLRYEAQHWNPTALRPGHSWIEAVFAWLDLGICLVFLTEFFLKLSLVQRRWLYFRRNVITGLLPAIPLGFVAYLAGLWAHIDALTLTEAADWFIVLRALRYLRLPQMARWLWIARPVLRMGRLMAFLLRASDQLVRRLSPLLNRNVVLFEQASMAENEPEYRVALAALRERFHYRAAESLRWLPRESRCRLLRARIDDLTAMLSAPLAGELISDDARDEASSREIPVERLISRLLTATPAGISDRIGRSLAESVTRWCRAFDVFGLRRLPVVRDLVSAGRLPSPYDTTAQVANRMGLLMEQMLERVYWLADLYGTVTAPQLVDSLGDWIVRGTSRPARRMLMIGLAFLMLSYAASWLPVLEFISHVVEQFVGTPLIVLGCLCLILMLLGTWFRQIANEATDFYSQVAEAQFIGATRKLKRQMAERNHALLERRVLAPERGLAGHGVVSAEAAAATAAAEMLWQDYVESPTFHRMDVGTTNQLLGNLVMISLRERRLAYGRRERKRLRQLDLASTRGSLRGPYLWFHFISRSLTHQTAKLLVDYNAFALPLSRAQSASDRDICRYIHGLSRRLGRPPQPSEVAPAIWERYSSMRQPTDVADTDDDRLERRFHGNDFTAMHFLSADPALDADLRCRYGDLVADLVRRDRRDNIRRVFRTYPLHHRPEEERTLNLLTLYQQHMAGGWVLLLPLKIAWWTLRLAARGIRLVMRLIGEVLHPSTVDVVDPEELDPLPVAIRKIHRMRRPLVLECLEMRARFDPEYLGVLLPGSSSYLRQGTAVPVEEDLALVDARLARKNRFRSLAAQRRRQVLELRAWLTRFGLEGQPNESLRAVAVAYTIGYEKVRSHLDATRQLQRTFDELVADCRRRSPLDRLPEWSLGAAWCRWRNRKRLLQLFEQPSFSHYTRAERRRCRRLVYCRRGPLLVALRRLTGPKAPADPVEHARRVLEQVARDPGPWTRQLVILRTIQTLSVVDLKTYCDLVYELGEYGTEN